MKFKQWVICESDNRSKEENEETPEKRKQDLLQAIIKDPYATIRFAEKLLHKNMPIPDIIMQTIIKNKDESRMTYDIPKLIETFLETHTPVPEELLKIAAEWPTQAANVAKEYIRLDMQVPEILIKGAADNSRDARYLASVYEYLKKPVPEILVIAAKKPPYSVRTIIADNQNVEEVPQENQIELLKIIGKKSSNISRVLMKYVTNKRTIPYWVMKTLLAASNNSYYHSDFAPIVAEKMRTGQSFDEIIQFHAASKQFEHESYFMADVYDLFVNKDRDDFHHQTDREYDLLVSYMQQVLNAKAFPFEKFYTKPISIEEARIAMVRIAEVLFKELLGLYNFVTYSKKVLEKIPKKFMEILLTNDKEFGYAMVKYLEVSTLGTGQIKIPYMDLEKVLTDEIIDILSKRPQAAGYFVFWLNESKEDSIKDGYPVPESILDSARRSTLWRSESDD